jgi:1-acyl-sn-glycerol-3-phosphate acyltransferase
LIPNFRIEIAKLRKTRLLWLINLSSYSPTKIMIKILAILKIVSLIFWTCFIYSAYALGLVFIKLARKPFERWRNRCMRWWGGGTARIMSMKIEVEGPIPKPPFLVVSNHLSYIDIPVYASVVDATFVSKAEVKDWPVMGFMATTLGIIFVDRGRKRDVTRVNREISEQLNERQGIILFPEGMTSPGNQVLRFRPSLLEHAASEEIEVSYSAIRYETSPGDLPAHHSVCWWGGTPLHTHMLRLASNRSITVQIKFGKDRISLNDRKLLATELHQRVEQLFVPVVDKEQEEFEPLKF